MTLSEIVWDVVYNHGLSKYPVSGLTFRVKHKMFDFVARLDIPDEPYSLYVFIDRIVRKPIVLGYAQASQFQIDMAWPAPLYDIPNPSAYGY